MSDKMDLALAYHMGYEDALAKRKPDASKTGLLAPSDLEAENAALRELLQRALTSHDKMCIQRGNCFGCRFFDAKPFAPACPIVSVIRDARELGVEVDDGD